MKKIMLLLAGSLLTTGVAIANPYYQSPGSGQAPVRPALGMSQPRELSEPAKVLQEGMNGLMGFLRSPTRPDASTMQSFVDAEVAPYFDFAYMAKWVAGPTWRRMNDEQRSAFEARLKQQFMGAMIQRLQNYNDQSVRFMPSRSNRGDQATVSVALINPRGYPTRVDFRMYKSADGWKIYDVVANGSSALIYYRNAMREMMYRGGQRPAR